MFFEYCRNTPRMPLPFSEKGSVLENMSIDPDREALLQIIERRPEIAGRFTNLQRIGSAGGDGHFSLIVTADDSVSGKRVALKFYNPFKRLDPDASYRFGCFSREAD